MLIVNHETSVPQVALVFEEGHIDLGAEYFWIKLLGIRTPVDSTKPTVL